MNLSNWRNQNELSRDQLAEMLGVSMMSVCRYENGNRTPNSIVMRKIVEVTKGEVTPNDFFDISPNQESNHITLNR